MKENIIKILIFALIVAAVLYGLAGSDSMGKGKENAISGLQEPVQTSLGKKDEKGKQVKIGDYNLDVTFKYKYEVDALVVSAKKYNGLGIQDLICPKDLAFAWGSVAELNKEIDFHWSQSRRFCNWHIDSADEIAKFGGVDNIIPQASNNHIFPADIAVKDKLKKVKKGDHIRLQGYLVDINGATDDGRTFYWYSSTTRNDDGDGACELIYTTDIEWLP